MTPPEKNQNTRPGETPGRISTDPTPATSTRPLSRRQDRHGATWCVEHKTMMLPTGEGLLCPFCWEAGRPNHSCGTCIGCLARAAVADGTAPWMTKQGRDTYRSVFS